MLKAGFSLLHVAISAANTVIGIESSDEDEPVQELEDADNSLNHTSRGILEFKAFSRTNKEKILHINLQKGTIIQYSDIRKKVLHIRNEIQCYELIAH